jgi:glycosyltransferase involved in cell wall biosynthesis
MIISGSSPVVTVILPTYNRAYLLARAIRSVLNQDFSALELVVVDDGSNDSTSKIISEFRDQRLHYVALKQNHGETFARNEGVHQARGDFIAQMDSDDIWLPKKLSYQINIIETYRQLDLIFCNFININHINGTSKVFFDQNAQLLRRLTTRELGNDAWEIKAKLPEVLLILNIITHSSMLYRRSLLQSTGLYNENLRGSGDFEFWWRATLRGAVFAFTTRVLLERHKDEKSLTADVLVSGIRRLQALQICDQTTRAAGRLDLLPYLYNAKYRAWRGIMIEQVRRGERKQAFISFVRSLKYGFSLELFSYLGNVLLGRHGVELIKKLIGPRKLDLVRQFRQATKKRTP